jgi:integrase
MPGQSPRWRKKYKGKAYYFPLKDGETKQSSYQRAYAEWLELKARIDAEAKQAEQSRQQRAKRELARVEEQLKHETRDRLHRLVAPMVDQVTMQSGKVDMVAARAFYDYAKHGEVMPEQNGGGPAPNSVGKAIDAFLGHKRTQAEAQQRSLNRYDVLRQQLWHFRDWLGSDKPIDALDESCLRSYYEYLIKQISQQQYSSKTASEMLSALKQFIRWAWQHGYCSLPRNLDSKDLHIAVKQEPIKTVSVDTVKLILSKASDKTKLYVLLMLNCGMTQKDISDLRPDEVDWKRGRIQRVRSKTDNHEAVPVVDYPLWHETWQLIKTHGNQQGERVFLNKDGKPLKSDYIKTNGRRAQNDAIKNAFFRLTKRKDMMNALQGVSLKQLRASAASLLGSHPEFQRYAQHFLGHSPRSVADKHYVTPSQQQFDNAIKWLGEQYDQ